MELQATDTHLCVARWGPGKLQAQQDSSPILEATILQLQQYFRGERTAFDLPLQPEGTPFQQQVWQELLKIPYGQTISYKELACRVGNPKASRAVGSANGKNEIFIIIPCHRVLQSDGKLGGYAYGLEMKLFLLQLEKSNSGFSLS
ncbi:MAG: methylated-DNA--[protein]-cysteine S-methyltransferase [Tannerellaceae bacterium]|nr:methylated-DNA--[protein]-cysteine S-methyltransferase [Tannerellaceae bacterium]